MKNLRCLVIGTFAVGALSVPSHAALLGLNLEDPDITSGFLDVVYDASVDDLSISGFALTYDDDGMGAPDNIVGGSFSIAATIDDTGAATGGGITIGGLLNGDGPILILGLLQDFGFLDDGGQILEFTFQVIGGDLAPDFGPEIGVILDMSSGGYSGDWSMSFDNFVNGKGTGVGVSNTGAVPAPSVLAMMLGAGLGVRGRRRR